MVVMKKKSVLIGISGGVDSAAAAVLLIEEGFHVEGLHIENGFPGRSEIALRQVSDRLRIPIHSVDASSRFRHEIIDYFISEYVEGRTPNPCIVCNKKIKFSLLIEEAAARGLDHCATGHYARIGRNDETGDLQLLRGSDGTKDQSYFLFELGRKELELLFFPNGNKRKHDIQLIARDAGLGSLAERESQDICFIPDNDYRRFMEKTVGTAAFRPGSIVNRLGEVVGRHHGIHTVTIGQRKGLNIASERPYYVIDIDKASNTVIVGRNEDQFFDGLIAGKTSWSSPLISERFPLKARVHIRYRHRGVDATIAPVPDDPDRFLVRFDSPQKAVTPGQAAVFYNDDALIGGGWIVRGVRND